MKRKIAMKINLNRSEHTWKYSGSLRRISSEHLDRNWCNGPYFDGSLSSACFSSKLCRNRCLLHRQFRPETVFSSAESSICHGLFASFLLARRLSSPIFSASSRPYHVGQPQFLVMSKRPISLAYGHGLTSWLACQVSTVQLKSTRHGDLRPTRLSEQKNY